MPRVPIEAMRTPTQKIEPTAVVAARVFEARRLQHERQGATNARLTNREIERYCKLHKSASALLERAVTTLGLSARAHHRVLKLARTIADLARCDAIDVAHISEAMGLRKLDRVRVPIFAALPQLATGASDTPQ
jgi:magnesium chelatase family protein